MTKKKKILIIVLVCVIAALLAVAAIFAIRMLSRPDTAFSDLSGAIIDDNNEIYQQGGTSTVMEELPENAETEIKEKIINVLLLGIDADYKPYAPAGGDRHTDAIMVVAINLEKDTVDLISIPRDTYTYVPGVRGVYKMNAAVNTGGGVDAPDGAGFKKTCDAVSWMLGGISIDYYYAVDFNAVVELVNEIGGVDFNVDMSYQGQSGNVYSPGMQHLDGNGVMDYIRARKNATKDATDRGRVDRQKRMMVALFKKLKDANLLDTVPKVISSVGKGLYTNTTLDQTVSLVKYVKDVDPDKIGQYSMSGLMNMSMGEWAFCYTDQDNRVELIKNIYGVDVPKFVNTSYKFATWFYNNDLLLEFKYASNAEAIADYIAETAGGADKLSGDAKADYDSLMGQFTTMENVFTASARTLTSDDAQKVKSEMSKLKDITEKLASKYNYSTKLSWNYNAKEWWNDPCINEVTVNFQ